MKTQIRKGTFETNSSSVHSFVMCNKSDYDKWEQGKVFLFRGSGYAYPDGNKPQENHFYTKEEAITFEKSSKYHPNFTYDTEGDLFGMNGAKIGKLLKNHSQQRMVILLLRLAMMGMTADKI